MWSWNYETMTAFAFRSILECNVLISTLKLVLVGLDAHKVSALEVNLEINIGFGFCKLFELEVENVENSSCFLFSASKYAVAEN